MLARTFKSPEELGITPSEHNALVLTLDALERGEIQHVYCNEEISSTGRSQLFTGHFNMLHWSEKFPECGTIACLGGTAEMLGNLPSGTLMNQELDDLFFPEIDTDYNVITVDQAAQVLRHYLTTGKQNWKEVLGETNA